MGRLWPLQVRSESSSEAYLWLSIAALKLYIIVLLQLRFQENVKRLSRASFGQSCRDTVVSAVEN